MRGKERDRERGARREGGPWRLPERGKWRKRERVGRPMVVAGGLWRPRRLDLPPHPLPN